jgi:hypothetical protein
MRAENEDCAIYLATPGSAKVSHLSSGPVHWLRSAVAHREHGAVDHRVYLHTTLVAMNALLAAYEGGRQSSQNSLYT